MSREDRRPPLGPQARAVIPWMAGWQLLRALGMILCAAALGTLVALVAREGFAVQRAAGDQAPSGLAEFLGSGTARLDGVLPAALQQPPLLLAGLVVLGAALRAIAEWRLSVTARRGSEGAKTLVRHRLLRRMLAGPAAEPAPDATRPNAARTRPAGGEPAASSPREDAGSVAVLAARGLDALDQYYLRSLTALVATAVVPPVLLAWILLSDPLSLGIILVTLPLVPVFMILIGRTTQDQTARAQDRLLMLSRHVVELARGLPVLIGLNQQGRQARALRELGRRYRGETLRTLRTAFLSSLALELITTISVALVAVGIGLRLVDGRLGLDTGLMILLLAPECFQPLREVGTAYHQSQDGVEALRRAERLTGSAPGHDDAAPAGAPEVGAGAPGARGAGDVAGVVGGAGVSGLTGATGPAWELRGVCAGYPGRGRVLGPVDLTLRPGTVAAVAGPSGAGKSTLLGVLAGLILSEEGRVSLPEGAVVRFIGQDPVFVGRTVREEMEFFAAAGADSSEATEAEVTAAEVTAAEVSEWLERLGLAELAETAPGALSSGQRRRLAVARALCGLQAPHPTDANRASGPGETRPRLLLMDEPTAHLDPRAADRVHAAVAEARRRGAAVLLVSHAPQLLARTDQVLRLDAAGRTASLTPGGLTTDLHTATNGDLTEESAEQNAPAEPAAAGEPAASSPGGRSAPQPVTSRHGVRALLRLASLGELRPRAAAGALALAVLTVLFGAALTALSGWLIVRAAQQPGIMYLMLAVTGVRFFGLGRAIFRYLERLATHRVVLDLAQRLRERLWDAFSATAPGFRQVLGGSGFLTRMIADVDNLRDALPRVLLPLGTLPPVLLLAVGATALTLPQAVAPVALAAVLSMTLLPWLTARADGAAEQRLREGGSRTLGWILTGLRAAEDLRANGLAGRFLARLSGLERESAAAARRASAASGMGTALSTLLWWGCAAAVAWLAWEPVASGAVSAPVAAIPVLLCTALVEPTAQADDAARGWHDLTALAARLAEALPETAGAEASDPDAGPAGLRTETVRDAVGSSGGRWEAGGHGEAGGRWEARGLTTRWPGMDRPALQGLTGEVGPGQWWGITGPSGSGKSTALAVMLGFLPAESGSLLRDGRPMRPEDLRGQSAWCPQEAHLFDSTLRGNLILARPEGPTPTDAEVREVLERVGLGELLDALPDGLESRVGAGGRLLSGGQRQRLAVARALLTRADLLLLDEPTAHLDRETAQRVMAQVASGSRGQDIATVVISHQPEDLAPCERISELRQAGA